MTSTPANRSQGSLDRSPPALALSGVTCQFGSVVAVRDIELAIAHTERVALVGPSGAGKSTLLNLLNGSLCPSQGSVSILNQPFHALRSSRRRRLQRRIGTVYQQHQLIDNLSVIHNVNAGHLGQWPLWKSVLSLLWPQEVSQAKQALAQLGLADKLYARTDRLSGGQQQRVAMARVLVQNPAIILADEPVASVDPARSHDMMAQLCTLGKQRTLVVSLHDVALARQYCDRIIGLRQGRIVFDQPSETVSDKQLTALYALSV